MDPSAHISSYCWDADSLLELEGIQSHSSEQELGPLHRFHAVEMEYMEMK